MKKVSVECRDICLSYGSSDVLKGISLRVEPGEFFALLGPSGSGKSTLLRLIAGFNKPRSGALLVDGQDIGTMPPWNRNIGMVFQSYALWPHMTVWDNVAFGLVERRVPRAEIAQRVGAALELVGLLDYAKRRPNQLSGGQQQRVALARTIVIEPQVLLLDEPLSNLDKNLRVQMRQELLALQRRLGITTIFVTHDQEEAMTTADRMAILDHGIIQQIGAPAELFDYPANRFVANFVGTMNILDGNLRHVEADVVDFAIDGAEVIRMKLDARARAAWPAQRVPGTRLCASFRPHNVRVAAQLPAADPAQVWLSGTVESSEFLGEFTRYAVRVGTQRILADHPHRAGQLPYLTGSQIALGIDAGQMRLLDATHD